MTNPTSVLVLPDIHYRAKRNGHDRRTLEAVKAYAGDHPWSHVIWLGDVMDHSAISHFAKGNLRSVDGESVMRDYEVANRDLDEFQEATPGAVHVVLEGNHDYRATRLVDEQPALSGIVETQHGLRIKERGWLWVPYWSKGTCYSLGKATFGHGRYGGQHHALKHAQRYGRNFYYGHLHDFQAHTVERDGDSRQFEAASLGCLCELQQEYLKGAPTKWQQGFGVFRFLPTGYFNRFEVRIFKHQFISPEGQVYRG